MQLRNRLQPSRRFRRRFTGRVSLMGHKPQVDLGEGRDRLTNVVFEYCEVGDRQIPDSLSITVTDYDVDLDEGGFRLEARLLATDADAENCPDDEGSQGGAEEA